MAVFLKEPEHLKAVDGIRLASCNADIYRNSRDDLVLIEIEQGSQCAAVFTRNAFAAAPVSVAKTHLRNSGPRFCLINSGNANAGTGKRGYQDAVESCRMVADQLGCLPEEVLPFSTGVIGEYLPIENMANAIPGLVSSLDNDNWLRSARAIMTTDTLAKGVSRTVKLGGETIQITGIAKGSGMIRPDMATMLAFIATDAGISAKLLERMLLKSVEQSFNRICVDGDTSTNDACLLIATGQSGVNIEEAGPMEVEFQQQLDSVFIELAQAIVRDGEGATKFVTITVQGAESQKQCREIAYDVATSPLVKTALYASDPNWGRIIAATGRSRHGQIDPKKINVFLNGLCIVEGGEKAESYNEDAGQREMSRQEIEIQIDLRTGNYEQTVWTCDLSHDYVKINAEYRS